MIPPSLQREMSERAGSTVVETPGSHSIYVSQPGVVADLVETAASEADHRRWPRAALTTGPPPTRSGRRPDFLGWTTMRL